MSLHHNPGPQGFIMENIGEPPASMINTKDTYAGETPYVGLSNQGATCYMNSLLQTLFMTPEFRKSLYLWQYDKKVHSKEENCIPLQLQKLFSKLQTKFYYYIETRDLTRSFQWTAYQSFEQQDIQEFCRVLFDAICITCKNSPVENFINDYYSGENLSYVKCMECGYESQRQENFLDICLTVKNKYDKIYNSSIEKALQTYIKPEILDGKNQYFCEQCNKKVNAHKGVKFFKMPKILCLIVNRFSYDFYLNRRIKLDDAVSFPYVLNLNDYINGYENIPNKLPETVPEEVWEEEPDRKAPPKKQNFKAKVVPNPTVNPPVIDLKKKKGSSSAQTRNFLDEIRSKQRGNVGAKQIAIEIYTTPDQIAQEEDIEVQRVLLQQHSSENKQNESQPASHNEPGIPSNKMEPETNRDVVLNMGDIENPQPTGVILSDNVPKPPINLNLAEKPKRYDYDKAEECISADDDEVKPKRKTQEDYLADKKKQQEEEYQAKRKIKEENFGKYLTEREEKIKKYMQDGPLVYELFAILIHSGGAYGGHYFTYIRSFEDGKWYNFNDSNVTELDVGDIPAQVFGGGKLSNAYMLFYRQVEGVDEQKIKISNEDIPNYIKELLKEEKSCLSEKEPSVRGEGGKKSNIVKVYYQTDMKSIQVKSSDTYKDLLQRAIEQHKLQSILPENIRLRAYNSLNDVLLDTYSGREGQTLEELKITGYKTLCLEVKKDNETFVEFDPNTMNLHICTWKEGIKTSDPNKLELLKFKANRNGKVLEMIYQIGEFINIPFETLKVIRKREYAGNIRAQVLNSDDYMDKSLSDLILMENSVLYVEEVQPTMEGDPPSLKWEAVFEEEINLFSIKFNTPYVEMNAVQDTEYQNVVVVDGRETLLEMKKKICEHLSVNIEEVILRRGGRQGVEIKDLNKIIRSQHLSNGSSIFIEFGKPSVQGQYRCIISRATATDLQKDNSFHSFEELFDLPIHGDWKPDQVKTAILNHLKLIKNIELDPQKVRVRERVSERLTRIYRDMPMKSQAIYERRLISIEDVEQDTPIDNKDHLIFVRIWDCVNWTLSDRFEVIIDKSKSLKDLANKIYESNQSIEVENMAAAKVIAVWNFNRYDVCEHDWFTLDCEDLLTNPPFYVNNDGYLLIVRDYKKTPTELTEEFIKERGLDISKDRPVSKVTTFRISSGSGVGILKPFKETGVKIHIKTKEDEQRELEEQAKKEQEEKDKKERELKDEQKIEGIVEEKAAKNYDEGITTVQLQEDELRPLGE